MGGISIFQLIVLGIVLFGGFFLYRKTFMSVNKDYSQAIFIAKLVSFIGWLAVIAGIIGLAISVSEGQNINSYSDFTILLISGTASIISSLFGLILVVAGQVSRAVMDNANYSAAMLEEMKRR